MSATGGGRARVGAIWAQDRSGLLGVDDTMLWRVPADFRHFKAATLGGALVMGRTTWRSLGGALPGRTNVVLSRQDGWRPDPAPESARTSVILARSLPEALRVAGQAVGDGLDEDPRQGVYRLLPRLWVVGGASVYAQALEAGLVDELVVTTLDLDLSGDQRLLQAGTVARAPSLTGRGWDAQGVLADPPGQWRPVSGDAAWRVDHWVRRPSC